MSEFDPSGIAVRNGQFFGLPYTLDEAEIVLLSAPWDVTTSYRDGTHLGPQAMLEASYQVDTFSPYKQNAWETRIYTQPIEERWLTQNRVFRQKAKALIERLEQGEVTEESAEMQDLLGAVNAGCEQFEREVFEAVLEILNKKKKVLLVGGDHSVSLGSIRAHAEKEALSILHFDAHADLRKDYEGFSRSHASIMELALRDPKVQQLTQVGIRDVSPQEIDKIKSDPRITTHFDWDLQAQKLSGKPWSVICDQIVSTLGPRVYLSIDIDGLDPRYCPHTGTPVPGGLELQEMWMLIQRVKESGREIVGGDLVEVSPGAQGLDTTDGDVWDSNVGARILYHLCQFL